VNHIKELVSKKKSADLLAIAALALMLGWFCDGMIFGNQIPIFRDLGAYFYPIKFSAAEAIKNGELPLWDRHMATGFPLMAGIQSAVFYPPSLMFVVLPFFTAIQLTFLFHYSVAALGSYLLLRSWKYPIYVSLIGAVLFTFGGTTVSLSNLLNHFQSAVWLPFAILSWERALIVRRWTNFLGFTVVLFSQLVAGSPEMFAISLILIVVDTVRLRQEGEIASLGKALTIIVATNTAVIGLAMVQLLPTAELILQSRRDQAIPAVEALSWSLVPSSLVGLLLPTVEADTSLSLGFRRLFSQEVPLLISHYLGIVAFLGICSWMYHGSRKERVCLIGLLTISLALAFGSFTPVYPFLFDRIGLLQIVRFPEKFFCLAFAVLLFASVRGLWELNKNKNLRSSCIIAVSILGAWSAVYFFLRWKTPLLVQFLETQSTKDVALHVSAQTLASILFTLEKQIAISFIIALLFLLRSGHVLRPRVFQCLLVAIVFSDLSLAHKPLQFLRDNALITEAPRVIEKPPADYGRLFYYPPGSSLHPSYLSVLASPSFNQSTQLTFNNLLPNAGLLFGFEYFQDIDALARRSYSDFLVFANPLPRERRNKLLGALNVRYLISFRELQIPGVKLVREFPEQFSWLYEISDPVPRAYIVSKAVYEPDARSTFTRLTRDDFDPRREVILDTPRKPSYSGQVQSNVAITQYENQRVVINAQLSAPGILVLTDSFYPGWKAYVNGREGQIFRANHLFRAVELPAGNQMVEFVYEPELFKIGLTISLFTAGLLVVVPLIGFFRARSRLPNSRNRVSKQPVNFAAE
jgi:hypothetical protein